MCRKRVSVHERGRSSDYRAYAISVVRAKHYLSIKETKMSEEAQKPICGVVMPISTIDGCNEAHWLEVFAIISDAVTAAGFAANMVSDADHVGIIQKRIIQNLYDNPIVVCDVSGKNPNVMFELGMRLAFDKPTIIIKDDKTSYSEFCFIKIFRF